MLREYVKPFAGVITVKLNENIAESGDAISTDGYYFTTEVAGSCYSYVSNNTLFDFSSRHDSIFMGEAIADYYQDCCGFTKIDARAKRDEILNLCKA